MGMRRVEWNGNEESGMGMGMRRVEWEWGEWNGNEESGMEMRKMELW